MQALAPHTPFAEAAELMRGALPAACMISPVAGGGGPPWQPELEHPLVTYKFEPDKMLACVLALLSAISISQPAINIAKK
jgi:hypothetical protein